MQWQFQQHLQSQNSSSKIQIQAKSTKIKFALFQAYILLKMIFGVFIVEYCIQFYVLILCPWGASGMSTPQKLRGRGGATPAPQLPRPCIQTSQFLSGKRNVLNFSQECQLSVRVQRQNTVFLYISQRDKKWLHKFEQSCVYLCGDILYLYFVLVRILTESTYCMSQNYCEVQYNVQESLGEDVDRHCSFTQVEIDILDIKIGIGEIFFLYVCNVKCAKFSKSHFFVFCYINFKKELSYFTYLFFTLFVFCLENLRCVFTIKYEQFKMFTYVVNVVFKILLI
eukprot:TRINITY_DN25000_c0_g2_i3.p1 TRINITY_DN25000_c0_g2~~TRINITY_DN25000_c0_g2_i3.p1  ORF type:complete len:282 (+),score=-11.07 TRINITY_DN25000_c0_g2_i3:947-1792(+)